MHESDVINIRHVVTKRQNKQDTKYDNGWLCQTTTGNNEIRSFSDQGEVTVVVAAATSGSITLPLFSSVFLFVKEQKLEHFNNRRVTSLGYFLPMSDFRLPTRSR
jgi:hypothetical protein